MASSFRVGVGTLRSNPLRTVLSTLGVMIGVASLVAVLAVGDGAEEFARAQIAQTTDLQTILITSNTGETIDGVRVPRADYPIFTLADVGSLASRLGTTARVAETVSGSAHVTPARPGVPRAANVMGVTPAAEERLRPEFASGRFFSEADVKSGRRVAVISAQLAEVSGAKVGDSVRLEDHAFAVVGVLRQTPKGTPWGMTALVPLSVADAAMAPAPSPRAPQILVRVARVEGVDAAMRTVERWTADRLGPGWRTAATVGAGPALRIDQARKAIRVFKLVMGAFAGISLIVGGIGIMNVLLAGVIERTREIGIRKAIGARRRDILVQFLSESVAITGVGSGIGVMLGLAGAFGITTAIRSATDMPLYAAFTWPTVAVAAAISVLIGVIFGMFPAVRASRLSPIDAIRHE